MKRTHCRGSVSGFTLIELLVVIAIIAILAAILFPVFAQAKVAAKKTVVLSNSKQMGTAMLIYLTDFDDRFSPAIAFTPQFETPSIAVTLEPYIKNFGIFMDTFGPAQQNSNPLVLNSQWGMGTLRQASNYCPHDDTDLSGCAFGVYNPKTAEITGGDQWGREGIAGVTKEPGTYPYFAASYNDTPSMTQTAVARVAETMMITQANTPDLMWSQDWNPDEAYRYWADGAFNLYGDANMNCAPASRIGASGKKAGIYPVSTYEMTEWPQGMNTMVFTDGHAKSQSWMALHSRTVEGPGGRKWLAYAAPRF